MDGSQPGPTGSTLMATDRSMPKRPAVWLRVAGRTGAETDTVFRAETVAQQWQAPGFWPRILPAYFGIYKDGF